jgi:hypothetical protein
VHPNPDLVLEIETDPTAWVLQDADSASGHLPRFVHRTANRRGSDGAARRSILLVLLRNGERAILKAFPEVKDSPGVPGPGIPNIGIVCTARGTAVVRHGRKPLACCDLKPPTREESQQVRRNDDDPE